MAVAFVVHVPWLTVTRSLVVPRISFSSDYLTVVVAILGTTISPYLFFWQAEEEVEDERERPGAKPLTRAPEQAAAEFHRIRVDTYLGMGLSNLVALFIMITAAATLNANGMTDIQTSSQAAEALRPVAGPCVFLIFSLGIIGTGLLALPVLAGSSAYAVGEAFGWHVGLARKPARAKRFYFTIAAITAAGAVLNVVALDPFKALFWSAVINGVVAVPVRRYHGAIGRRPLDCVPESHRSARARHTGPAVAHGGTGRPDLCHRRCLGDRRNRHAAGDRCHCRRPKAPS